MGNGPDPDSEEMDRLGDRWLYQDPPVGHAKSRPCRILPG